jgi:hypothetical protein
MGKHPGLGPAVAGAVRIVQAFAALEQRGTELARFFRDEAVFSCSGRIFSHFFDFLQYFMVFPVEITENACIFLYRLFFHTDRTRKPPAPVSGPARGEKELHT